MNAYVNSLARYLFAQSWQIALLAAIVALISFALRNKSAHIRYLLWLIVLAKCIVPPVYSVPVPVLPDRPLIERLPHPATPETQVADLAVRANAPIEIEAAVEPQESKLALPGTKETAVLMWSLGAFLFLVWVGVRAVRYTVWLRSRRSPLPDHLRQILQESLKNLKLKKLPRIWLTQDIGQPFVWGLLRGSVYLPVDFLDLDGPERCRTILAHELSHVARFDAAINLLQVLAQAIYWFHPLVWWVNRRIRMEREKCCDEMAVVHLSAPPEQYTGAIVEVLATERRSAHPIPTLAIVGSVKDIEERIRTMLRPGRKFYKRPSLIAVLIVLLLALLTVPTALVLTAEAQEKTTATPPPAPTAKDKAAATAALFRAIRDNNVEKIRLAINQGADLEAKNKDTIFLIGDIQSIGCTPLYAAAGVPGGNDNVIGLLLEGGANPNTRGPDGQIALHAAVWDWQISVVELLVSEGSDVNAADKEGRTPAMIAFELGQTDMFDLMVGRGANVSTDLMSAYKGNLSRVQSLNENGKAQGRFEQGLTLLHAAAAGGHTAIVGLLLTNGLDVHSKTQEGYTALHYAAAGNHREVAELLLAKGADVNTEPGKQTPLHWAIREQHKDMIDWLLARGGNPNADAFGTPLHWAVWWGDVDIALLLVSHGGDVHLVTQTFPYSPLLDSVFEGNPAMAEALVTKTGDTRAAQWAPFHATVVSGNRQAIEHMLAKGADVNAKGEMGFLALHLAARKGHKDIAELLIEKGADVNSKSGATLWDPGMTALHASCSSGQKGVAELLIAKGADVNAKSKNGYTPLHIAATEGYRDVAELLIAKGADVNAKDYYGRPPLSLAKNRGRTEVVELLKKHGATNGTTASPKESKLAKTLHQAAADGDLEQIKLLLAKGLDVDTKSEKGATPLHLAAREGHKDTVEFLIAKGADINALNGHGAKPVWVAMAGGHRDVVESLIKKGAKVLPMKLAACFGDTDRVSKLIQEGVDVNAKGANKGRMALHWAVAHGHKDTVELLIKNGANVSGKASTTLWTPLHVAAHHEQEEMVELLIAHGADVLAKGQWDYTPLHVAAWGELADVVEMLIDAGADVNAEDEWGGTPLDMAVGGNRTELVARFIAKGKDPNRPNSTGGTPLHRAAHKGSKEVMQLLLSKGVDVNCKDEDGSTPIQIAIGESGCVRTEVVRLLVSHGAEIPPIHAAAYLGDMEKVKALLEAGADVNAPWLDFGTPLYVATAGGQKDIAELLLAEGADVDAGNKRDWTPLHNAAQNGCEEVVRLLIDKGADIHIEDSNGFAPVLAASCWSHQTVVDALLDAGADINARDNKEMTALHFLAWEGQQGGINMMEFLLARGADIEAKSMWDTTPLFFAVQNSKLGAAQFLLSKGANINVKGNYGQTPLSVAKEKGRAEMVELLRKHGAEE